MLIELLLVLSIIAGMIGITYPALSSVKEAIHEQAEINKIVNTHRENVDKVIKLDRPTKFNNVTYYPNLTNQPTVIETKKHKVIIGKYNTLRIERKR